MLSYLSLGAAFALSFLGVARSADTACDATCLANITSTWEATQHVDPEFTWYKAPSNFSASLKPGSLLEVEYATNLSLGYVVPAGLSMSRIIYTTTDVHNNVLPASAYILWPYQPQDASAGGYQMVAWAHGTSGVFRTCAPSNYRHLQYNFMVPFELALEGYVVVAPDYAGLGVNALPWGEKFRHAWATSPAQANDLANAILAARVAFPQYLASDGPYVAMGHSQGGRAAWAYAERQAEHPVEGYRGTVALAPLSDAIAQVEQAAQDLTKPWALTALSLQPKLIDAVTAVYPSYQHAGFTKTVAKLWKLLKNVQGCLPTDSVIFSTITSLDQLARKGWTQDEEVQKWANLTRVGGKKFAGPLLALAGEADIAVPHELVTESVDQTCNFIDNEGLDASLEFVSYAALDHFPLIQGSRPTWLPWIRKQLCDTPPSVEKGCVRKTVEGFRNEYSPQSTTPNWLVDLAAATEVWKYTL